MIRTDSPLSPPSPSIQHEEEIPKKSFGAKALHVAQEVTAVVLSIILIAGMVAGYGALWVFWPEMAICMTILVGAPLAMLAIGLCSGGLRCK